MSQSHKATLDRWMQLMSAFDLEANQETYDKLIAAHGDKHRAYHTLEHIEACFRHLDGLGLSHPAASEIELSFWFHDAIYKPFSSTNEEDSAEWAKAFMTQNKLPSDCIKRVFDLIILTKTHSNPQNQDAAIMLDIDLSILGAPPNVYDQYEKNIRIEYKRVPFFLYKKKRKEILQSFLDMERIYTHEPFFEKWEARARANLIKAVADL